MLLFLNYVKFGNFISNVAKMSRLTDKLLQDLNESRTERGYV